MFRWIQRRRILIGRILGVFILITCAFEFRSAFVGRHTFIRKPSLILTPLYAPGIDAEYIADVRLRLEKELNLSCHFNCAADRCENMLLVLIDATILI